MTPEQDAQTQHDPPYEDMIRNRRRIAPGHWSNKDIDCLLRRLDEARTERDAANRGRDAAKELAAQWGFRLAEAEEQWDAAAADARRQAIEECLRLCENQPIRSPHSPAVMRFQCAGAIRALLPPAAEERG